MRIRPVRLLAAATTALCAAAFLAPAADASTTSAGAGTVPAVTSTASAVRSATVDPHRTASASVAGGDVIYANTGLSCRISLNVRDASHYYALLPGHCTNGATTWYTDAAHTVLLGPTVGSSFPGNDFGLVRYDNPAVPHPGTVDGIDVTGAANAFVGMPVVAHGGTGGTRSGTVTGLNATVNYPDGIITGLISTTICTESGDGSTLLSGTLVVGILVGGSGTCSSGGTSFYQPAVEALSAFDVSVY